MRYLKRFNETYTDKEEEVKDFFERNLSYLIDMKYKIMVLKVSPLLRLDNENLHTVQILCNNKNGINISKDKWSDIKDEIIPFITILNNEYPILRHREMTFRDGEWTLTEEYHDIWIAFSSGRKYLMMDDILNDNLDLDQFGTFSCMYMTIERK
jgi:hypothetical protein